MALTQSERELLLNEQFERAKAYLMSANKDGISVYDQLTRLMEHLLNNETEDALQDPTRFAELLALVQKHSFVQGESTATGNEPAATAPIMLQRLHENQRLFERPAPEVRTTIEQPDPYTTITTTTIKPLTAPSYPSVAKQNRFWAAAGCGLAEEEAFLLDHSITKLAMEKNLQDVRFVGKLFGLQGNYYVISSRRYLREGEVVYQEVNTMPRPPRKNVEVPVQPEPGFVGCNSLSFWVTSYPSAPWVLLPDVTPQQITAARHIKRLLTGDLGARVVASPTFAWDESVYLRAQLSRIVSATFICPQGAMQEPDEDDAHNEDDDDVDDDENDEDGRPRRPKEAHYRPTALPARDFAEDEVDVAQFASVAQWVHAEREIMRNGRQTKVPERPPATDDDEAQAEGEDDELVEEDEVDGEEGAHEDESGDDESEGVEEEERELFLPIQGDHLYAVLDVPQPAPVEMEEDEDDDEEEEVSEEPKSEAQRNAAATAAAVAAAKAATLANNPAKPVHEDDVAAEDVTKIKVAAWSARLAHNLDKAHRVAVVHSLRWPGAIAYVAEGGRRWGCVYFGNGLKKVHPAFTPALAPAILGECADVVEVMDPTAATEKLIRRGEEVPENDSEEDEGEEEEEV